jgi:hypothetical protein
MEGLIDQVMNGDLPEVQELTVEVGEEPPVGEVTIEGLIAMIGELEVIRRGLLNAFNRLRVENAALKARVEHLEADEPTEREPED